MKKIRLKSISEDRDEDRLAGWKEGRKRKRIKPVIDSIMHGGKRLPPKLVISPFRSLIFSFPLIFHFSFFTLFYIFSQATPFFS